MAQLPDSLRTTPAANADILGEETTFDGTLEKPRAGDGAPADGSAAGGHPAGNPGRRENGDKPESGSARAGKDINQAGFLKDPDAAKP